MRTLILRLLRADPFLKIVTNDGRERTIKRGSQPWKSQATGVYLIDW